MTALSGQISAAHQITIAFTRCTATFVDGPHHQTLATAAFASGEDTTEGRTGDQDLLVLNAYLGIDIVTPALAGSSAAARKQGPSVYKGYAPREPNQLSILFGERLGI
jgi:hypothetical protein